MNKDSSPKCPYCDHQLDNFPKRKKKCPSCSNQIFVRWSPNQEQPVLVTEEESAKIDQEKENIREKERLISKIKEYDFTEEEFNKIKRDFYEKNKFEMKDNDAIWTMFNSKVTELIKEGNYSDSSITYYQMALFLTREEGRNPLLLLQASNKTKLLECKQEGIKKVEISSSGNGCNHCEKQNGKIYKVDVAFEKSILPNINCTFDAFGTSHPFCRCIYLPVLD